MSVDAQSTVSFACPNCQTSMKAPSSLSGRKARCKGCGQGVLIPPPDGEPGYDVAAFDDFPEEPETPTMVAVQPPPLPPLVAGDPDESPKGAAPAFRTMPPEPWFYRFLSGYAQVVAVLGIAQFGLVSILCIYIVFRAARESQGYASLGAGLIFVYSLGVLFVSLCFAAPVLLGVDMARNIRVMRYFNQR